MPDNSFAEIIPNGWKSLFLELTSRNTFEIEFPDLIAETSLDSILKEMIFPPEPEHIKVLWGIYNPAESIPLEIANCLAQGEAKPSWKQIAKILKDTSCERLYQIASQNAYRLEHVCDHESQKILQDYNNILVECLVDKWINPPQRDLEIKALFDGQGLSFKKYQFLDLILEYYRLLLPYPYRLREHPGVFADYIKYNAPAEFKQRFHDEVSSRENRVKERFAFYKYCNAAIYSYIEKIEGKAFYSILDRSKIEIGTEYDRGHAARVSRPHDSFVSLQAMMERSGNLFQCPFCYRFSNKGLPAISNQFPSHCERIECKKAYKSWSRYVKRAGFSAENRA
jgi:hypothetical protein